MDGKWPTVVINTYLQSQALVSSQKSARYVPNLCRVKNMLAMYLTIASIFLTRHKRLCSNQSETIQNRLIIIYQQFFFYIILKYLNYLLYNMYI